MNSYSIVRLSFPSPYYLDKENEKLILSLLDYSILQYYDNYCCCIRNDELSFLDYWISYRDIEKQDLIDVINEIKQLGLICDVEVCNNDNLKYSLVYRF